MRKKILIISAVVVLSIAVFFFFRGWRAGGGPPPDRSLEPVEYAEGEGKGIMTPVQEDLSPAVEEAVGQLEEDDLRLSAAGRLIEEWALSGDGNLYTLLEVEAVPLLIEDYRSSADLEERDEIIDLLGRIDSDSAIAFLLEIARSGDRLFSPRAMAALARSSNEQAGVAVAEFIASSRSERARWEMAREVAAHGGEILAQPLVSLFHDGEPRSKIVAVYAIKGIYDRTKDEKLGKVLVEEAIPSISEMAQTYLDPQIKRDSWDTLGYVDPALSLKLYRQQKEMAYAVEERAILSIGRNGDEKVAVDAIALFDEAESERKRVSACRIVARIGSRRPGIPVENFMNERARPFLREVAADRRRDRRLRKMAIAALGEAGDKECLPLLKELAGEYPREAGRAIEKVRSRTGAR